MAIRVTMRLEGRSRLFRHRDVVQVLAGKLEELLIEHRCSAPVYAFLPNEFHAVIVGLEAGVDPRPVSTAFRAACTEWLQLQGHTGWEPFFYSRLLPTRRERDVAVLQITEAPIERKTSMKLRAFPFFGSIHPLVTRDPVANPPKA
jgi:hypothetical protein